MTLRFPHLYSPVTIGSMSLKNRLVRSATYEARADEKGDPTEGYLDFYHRLEGRTHPGSAQAHQEGRR